jgi:hypothetical protein
VGRCVLRRGNGEDYVTRSFMICNLHQYYLGYEIENEMGETCNLHRKEKRSVKGFGGET